MEAVVLVSVVVLCVVFVTSMVLLLLICRHKYCRKLDLLSEHHQQYAPEQTLVTHMEVEQASGVELDHVTSQGRTLENILDDAEWVNDATGLAPHCLAILRTCHMLSTRLVGMTMRGNTHELCSPETMTDLVATAKRIGPRVDDVVKALYPPLDPRLLEARCTALVLSVSHLVLITKNACRLSGVLDWIDQSLADVDDHLRVLREASIHFDECSPQQQQQIMQQSTTQLSYPPAPNRQSNIHHSNQQTNYATQQVRNQPSSAQTSPRAWVSSQQMPPDIGNSSSMHFGVRPRVRPSSQTPATNHLPDLNQGAHNSHSDSRGVPSSSQSVPSTASLSSNETDSSLEISDSQQNNSEGHNSQSTQYSNQLDNGEACV